MTIRDLLLEAGALRFGDFTLASGETSDYYVDVKRAATRPRHLRELAKALAGRLPEGTDAIGCVALGGVPLGTAVSLESGLPLVVVRKTSKDHGTRDRIMGEVGEGTTVCLIEDVTTTGQSALAAVRVLRDAGARLVDCLVVVDRGQGASDLLADEDVTLTPLVGADELVEDRP